MIIQMVGSQDLATLENGLHQVEVVDYIWRPNNRKWGCHGNYLYLSFITDAGIWMSMVTSG